MRPSSRHLAAIMFTDIVGYSALMQADEAKALELLEKHWQIVRPAFNRHNGREIKTIGDAFLVEFSSALHAVYAALDIQSALAEHNRSAKEEDRISIRIGIHLGDVEQRENDVFGDGVNIASRIEPLAPPGGVCITEPVYDLIKNKVEKRFHPLGPQSLKNIGDPVSVYSSDPIQQKPEQSATGQGINVWLTTLVQVILNPGKSALRYGENPGSMVGPVKLIIVVIAIFIVTTFFLPYPDEFTTSEIVLPEYLPYAAQVLDHEMIDKTKLDNQLAQIETVYNFIFNLVLILIMALAMRLVDGKRFLSTHFTVVAYAFVPATFFGDTTLALLGALDASTEVIIKFSAIGNFLLIFYLVYAIFSSYRPRILVPLYQTFVVFVTFVISSVPLVFTMHITQIIFARTVYGDYVDRNGNMDIYLASVIESNGSLKIVRENNATHHTGLDEAPSFTKDGNYMLYVSKEGEEKRDVYLFNLKSEERSRLTNTEDIDEHAPGEFPGGGLAVIRDAALWVYPDNEEAYPLSPEGEAVEHYAWGPEGQVLLLSGEPHRLALYNWRNGEFHVPVGFSDIGHAPSWHGGLAAYTFTRKRNDQYELVAFEPESGNIEVLIGMPRGGAINHHAWINADTAICASGSKIFAWTMGKNTWKEIADLDEAGIRHIRWLAANPSREMLAIERERPNGTWERWMRASDEKSASRFGKPGTEAAPNP